MPAIFISPHNDDETLFGWFTLERERPLVAIVYDGHVQAQRGLSVTWHQRRTETAHALSVLGLSTCFFLGFSDADASVTSAQIWDKLVALNVNVHSGATSIYAPAYEEDGHDQHNTVARAVPNAANVTRYLTYTREKGKSTSNRPVHIPSEDAIIRKWQALACYRSQLALDRRMGCWPHFLRSQEEYYL